MQIETLGKQEKFARKPKRIKVKDKTKMTSQSKDMLGYMQEDVKLYMEKHSELEDKNVSADIEINDEIDNFKFTEKVEDELYNITEIEDEVDKFLSKRRKKFRHH